MISGEKGAFSYRCHNEEFSYSIDGIQKWVIFMEEEVTMKKGKEEWLIMVKPWHLLINKF